MFKANSYINRCSCWNIKFIIENFERMLDMILSGERIANS